MSINFRKIVLIALAVIIVLAAGGYWFSQVYAGTGNLTASGTIEAQEVNISVEIAGKASAVLVSEGDAVHQGDVLLRLDTTLLTAQRQQTADALKNAQLAQQTAEAAQATAQAQYNLAVSQVQNRQPDIRSATWKATQLSGIQEPGWYFSTIETLGAANKSIQTAQDAVDSAQNHLNSLLADSAYKAVTDAETRLVDAQQQLQVASTLKDQANAATNSSQQLRDNAQQIYDAAKSEVDAAQSDYNRLLTTTTGKDLSDARAKLAVAQAQLEIATSQRNQLYTGDQDLSFQLAQASLDQAKAAASQAQAAVDQAQAALDLIDAQISKMTVTAPSDGTVLERSIEPGEYAVPGSTVLVIGRLDTLKLTVYIPENQYGQIKLGQTCFVSVDSFPGQTFEATVTHIADQAEFTPRNVQTTESRVTTVFAIDLTINSSDGKLKPGMPADVSFTTAGQ
jgi:multidrug resistance efflux pump